MISSAICGRSISNPEDGDDKEDSMPTAATNREAVRVDRDAFRLELDRRLAIVTRKARRYRYWNATLLLIAVLFGLVAAALAADSARDGSIIAKPVAEATTGKPPSDLPKGWRNVCGLIAVFTLIGTAATGISNALKISEHQTKAFVCAGALDALRTDLLPDSTDHKQALEKIEGELSKLLKDYPEYFI
jgi:hypothetical protein